MACFNGVHWRYFEIVVVGGQKYIVSVHTYEIGHEISFLKCSNRFHSNGRYYRTGATTGPDYIHVLWMRCKSEVPCVCQYLRGK